MVKARTDLTLVMGLAVAACVIAALLPASLAAFRAPIALPLVLVLPGYAVVRAIFVPDELRGAELALLSIAVSIAASIVTGLLLDLLSVRLTALPWMGLLAALTLGAAARGTARGNARPISIPRLGLRGGELGFTPLAPPKRTTGNSMLWLVPAPGGRNAVCVGVINQEFHADTFTVEVVVAGAPARRFSPIKLTPGGAWSRVVDVGSRKSVVTATLSKAATPSAVYRNAALRAWNIQAVAC